MPPRIIHDVPPPYLHSILKRPYLRFAIKKSVRFSENREVRFYEPECGVGIRKVKPRHSQRKNRLTKQHEQAVLDKLAMLQAEEYAREARVRRAAKNIVHDYSRVQACQVAESRLDKKLNRITKKLHQFQTLFSSLKEHLKDLLPPTSYRL